MAGAANGGVSPNPMAVGPQSYHLSVPLAYHHRKTVAIVPGARPHPIAGAGR